jgi:hypothetical protein
MMNHRESWAEERTAPTRDEWIKILEDEATPKKREKKTLEAPPETKTQEKKSPPVVIRRTRKEI